MGILASTPFALLAARDALAVAVCDFVGAPVHPASLSAMGGASKGATVMRIAAASADHALRIAAQRLAAGGFATPLEAVYDDLSPAALIDCCAAWPAILETSDLARVA